MTRYGFQRFLPVFVLLLLFMTACSTSGGNLGNNTTPTPAQKSTQAPTGTTGTPTQDDTCPIPGFDSSSGTCLTPHQYRLAYGVESLIEHGYTGTGQTVVDVVSFGSPTLQQDMNIFDQQFGLPPVNLQVISPLNEPVYDPYHQRGGWAGETELDVQIIHAIAPGAKIVVLTSPVAETEGTVGLPEFLKLEQYALAHYPGSIVSQSWGASEVSLKDAAGQQEIQKWNTFFQQATTQGHITFFGSSGDNGATDYIDQQATKLSPVATTSFPADSPWITSVGGTHIITDGITVHESAWSCGSGSQCSGGGFSSFFPEPSYQQTLPASVQGQINHRRGVPDVAGAADPSTGLALYFQGQWGLAGGTSASAPLWAGIMAIANQMAGHSLGFINPALYKLATSGQYDQDFRDITTGNNSQHSRGVNVQGYPAVTGWDPITGLGAPISDKLIPDLINVLKS